MWNWIFPKDDKKVRCGVGPIFTTEWMWKLAHKLGLTRHKEDPFISVCEADDKLTEEKRKLANLLSNQAELERVEEMFKEVNKDVNHPLVMRLEIQVLRLIRWYFDKN